MVKDGSPIQYKQKKYTTANITTLSQVCFSIIEKILLANMVNVVLLVKSLANSQPINEYNIKKYRNHKCSTLKGRNLPVIIVFQAILKGETDSENVAEE